VKLSATDIGKKLYEKHGFIDIKNGMKLIYDNNKDIKSK